MNLVPYNATNVPVRHACYRVVLVPAYCYPSVVPVTCVAPPCHCSGSGAGGDQHTTHTSLDEYDRWCKRMEAGKFDPKPGTPGYPVRCTGVFLLRSENNKEIFVFCIKELDNNRICSVKNLYDKQQDWKDVSKLELTIVHRTNGHIELISDELDGIDVSAQMNESFQKWITSNGFVRDSYSVHEGLEDDTYEKVEDVIYQLHQSFKGADKEDKYNAWREKIQAVTYELPDEYDLWCEKIKAGELDPKPAERGYPARFTDPILLRSIDKKEIFCFFMKEVYGKRICLARSSSTQKKQNWPYNASRLKLEILHRKNECILSIIGFGDIKVSKEMLQSFRGWIKANDFVCISDSTEEGDGNVVEDLVYKLPDALPNTDLFDAWVARVIQGGYRHLTHPFLLRSSDGKRTFRFAIYRRPESLSQSCVWTPKKDIDTKRWFQNSQVSVLFEKSTEEELWEIYIFTDDTVSFLIIDKHMKAEFEAWLSKYAKSKTPKTDPVYYNARGYSYAF